MDAADLADRVSATAPTPSWVVLATAVVGIVISLAQVLEFSTVARSLNVLDTLVHESGHAALAILTSGRVHRLELATARSGSTLASTIVGVRSVMTSAAGYAAVPLAGLGAAGLLAHGHAAGVVALLGALALLVLPIARGMITLITVLAIVVLSGLLLWLNLSTLHIWAAHLIASVLLCSGLTSQLPLVLNRMQGTTTRKRCASKPAYPDPSGSPPGPGSADGACGSASDCSGRSDPDGSNFKPAQPRPARKGAACPRTCSSMKPRTAVTSSRPPRWWPATCPRPARPSPG